MSPALEGGFLSTGPPGKSQQQIFVVNHDFATKYDRNDKLAGKIDYVGCTITTSNCDEEYILDNVDCEIKVRGNYTLNYTVTDATGKKVTDETSATFETCC